HPQQEREHETEYRYQESKECWEENDLCSTAAKLPPKELENAGLLVSLKEAMLTQGEIPNAMNHKVHKRQTSCGYLTSASGYVVKTKHTVCSIFHLLNLQ
ncbi:hypothetical protein P7K49_018387, partial [Saguinus oedipus]